MGLYTQDAGLVRVGLPTRKKIVEFVRNELIASGMNEAEISWPSTQEAPRKWRPDLRLATVILIRRVLTIAAEIDEAARATLADPAVKAEAETV